MDKLVIKRINKHELEVIKPLWNCLNKVHQENSKNFKDFYSNYSFEKRIMSIQQLDEDLIYAEIAEDVSEEKLVGYCISTKRGNDAEIDSIYIDDQYRRTGLGSVMINNSLKWFEDNNCNNIFIKVADGNENVLDFYEKFGFKKRLTFLQKKENQEHNL